MGIENKYSLPFDTALLPLRISQGNNGPWSHFLIRREILLRPGMFSEQDLIHAVDFALPIGTLVRAVADGQVFGFNAYSDWYYEGLDQEIGNSPPPGSTNFVMLSHADGTLSLYSHLSHKIFVKRGEFIRRGDIIGETGKSGWIARIPHLHFQVSTQTSPPKSIPLSFEEYHGPLDHNTLLNENLIWFGNG